jgi:TolA-binding protein
VKLVDRLTRHELKQDELRSTFEQFEQFIKERYQQILTVAGMVLVVVAAAVGLKIYLNRQVAEANTLLTEAITTFRAPVGAPAPGNLDAAAKTFPTAKEKYEKALSQFADITQRFPRTKAAAIARYHVGVCQAELGDQAGAIKTLTEATGYADKEIAALAQLALAGQLVKTGKLAEAVKIYQDLAARPTTTVPRATALLALADAYRGGQPAEARRIYAQLEKEAGTESMLSSYLKQQMESLPK